MENKIVSQSEWKQARLDLLQKEKEFTRLRDELCKERRSLPWTKVEKEYSFNTNEGQKELADLFDGRSQLIIYHFMYGPDWGEQGCKSCSFLGDNFDSSIQHLKQRDVTMIAVSRNSLEKINAFKERMNWTFPWASSLGSDFNYDFHVSLKAGIPNEYNYVDRTVEKDSEWPGMSVFYKSESGEIFHTYSNYARGLEDFINTYRLLDIVPKGRDESKLSYGMAWVKHHDKY